MRPCLALLALLSCTAASALTLGPAEPPVVVLASGATPAEAEAASELVSYLELSIPFDLELVGEGEWRGGGPSVQVGPTAEARKLGPDPAGLGPEEWIIISRPDRLFLYGGRPRGTLYAVYRFLEEQVGVRWWSPHDEYVPRHRRLELADLEQRGKPAFAYRDIYGIRAEPRFYAHSRLNGNFSRLPVELGGSERYGPPRQAHTFYDYVPPDLYFESMPELFSERQGIRSADYSQLCLSNPRVRAIAREKMIGYIEETRGENSPTLFSFSPNDWGGACTCKACRELSERYGGQGGVLAWFMNGLADDIGKIHPEVLLDTLAYGYTLPPPQHITLRDNVVVRFSALQSRDRSRQVTDPGNHDVREALEGWLRACSHLVIWDYAVAYGESGDPPMANLPVLAGDLRYYRDIGVEGVFLQHDFPVSADMRYLKLWVLAKLMVDPGLNVERLVDEFTEGYFGAGGKPIRRYLAMLERAMARDEEPIPYAAEATDIAYLDARFLQRSHKLFDRAERKVAGDALRLRRVRHARLSLDRATLWLWPAVGRVLAIDREAVARRYRETWIEQIALVYPEDEREAALEAVEAELSVLSGRRYNLNPTVSEDRP